MIRKIAIVLVLLISFSSCEHFSKTQIEADSVDEGHKQIQNTTSILWPVPKSISVNSSAEVQQFDLSDITFKIEALVSDRVQAIIDHYLVNVFKSEKELKKRSSGQQITMNIVVKSSSIVTPELVEHEKYQITIRQNEKWELIADYFPGFVRGFQTFSQLLEKQANGKYAIKNRPVLIDDQPDLRWRGLMIDTSRHYLPISQIKKMIDGIMYNKMNVLHWHIIDQDSFPMEVPARPGLAKYGNLAGTYSPSDLTEIQRYASSRAIRVIPEYDSPAHTKSWGRSPELSNITVDSELPYQGQFNPTIELTYEVVSDVTKYVNSIFTDRYVHLGGDEVNFESWDKHPEIKEWMKENNVSDYDALQIYYRKKQRSILKSVNGSKKAIYWANEQINLPVDQSDAIQWWGDTQNLDQIKKHPNEIILSNYDLAYLDVGFGDELGDPYQEHISWRDMYKFTPKIAGVNIIGGEACMWAETAYKQNIEQKVWIRSSALAERMWNMDVDINKSLLNIVYRLIEQKKRMQARGFKTSPVTVGLCEKDPTICFN